MERLRLSTRVLIALGMGLAATPAAVMAQASAPAARAGGLEEVVVTARKREETLKDVPISITAFTAETMEQRGIVSVYDIARLTPNLSFNQTYGRAFDRPVIRGQSQILGDRTVSFVVDGVYIAGNITGADLDDVESVEVLKGPQAANFGRASLAGVISYRTKRPAAQLEGRASASVGDDGYTEISGNLSGPLVADRLSFKLGARYYDYDGQYTGLSSDGRTARFGAERTKRVSGALRWQASDDLDFTLRAFGAQNADGLYSNILYRTLNCYTNSGAAARGGSYCGVVPTIPLNGAISVDLADIERQGHPGIVQDSFLYSAEGNWRLGPVTATALVSWNRQDEDWITDDFIVNAVVNGLSGPTQTPGPTLRVANPGNITRLIQLKEYRSQELRLASNGQGRWQWLAGLYHYDQVDFGFNGGPRYNILGANGLPAATNTGPVGTLREFSQPVSPRLIDNRAVFGSVSFDPSDRWHLTLEGRYARDELTTNNTVQTASNCPKVIRVEFTSFSPRATVRFDMNDDANVYVSVARGNKPGDFNTTLCGSTIPAAEFARLSSITPLAVKEEKSLNYELGTKLRLLDNRMSLEAAVFFTDWTDQQISGSQTYTQVSGAPNNISLIGNAGKTQIKGAEFNWRYRVGAHWDFNLAYGFTDAKFDKLCDATLATILGTTLSPVTSSGPCPTVIASATVQTRFADASGFQTANAPKHTLAAGAEFRLPLRGTWTWVSRVDLSYQSERFAEIYNHASTGDSTRVNLRLGIENGDHWRITAWGRNIFDDRSPDAVVRFFDPDTPTAIRAFQVHYPNGRQLGVTATYAFR